MPKTWTGTAFALVVVAIGLLFAVLPGMWVFNRATATVLHPNPQESPSVAGVTPVGAWADAAGQARQIVRAALAAQNLPGLSVAVGSGREIVWAEGFGWADFEQRLPVSPRTRFRIGTASVALTSAAVGLLMEHGQIDLEAKIQAHVPEFPEKQWPVTLRQVMGHLSGVRNDGGDEGPLFAVHCERPLDALPSFKDRPLLFEPGTRFHYSSYGWILASAAIEAAAGEPFLGFMRRQIFEPLGMNDTVADSATAVLPERATSYFPRFAADPLYGLHLMRDIDLSCYAGSSAFLSTPSDLVRFAIAIDSGQLLQPATVTRIQTSQRLASGQETGYGLGWDLETAAVAGQQTPLVGHNGETLGGMVASFMTLPEHGITVAVTSNISYADTFAVAVRIAAAFVEQGNVPAGP